MFCRFRDEEDGVRVLVTGAGGYLGRAVVAAARAAGYEPVAMVHSAGTEVPGASEIRVADLVDQGSLWRAVQGMDVVCHLAGLTRARESIAQPLRYFRVNTGGTVALLEAMARAEISRLVFASTGAIYGTPDRQPMDEELRAAPPHPYASSKYAAELAIEAQAQTGELGAVILRLPNVAGGVDPDPTRLVPRALSAAGHGVLEVNGYGTAVRDYLHIADAADAFVKCLEHVPEPSAVSRYNIGSGRGTTVLEVAAAVERVTGRSVAVLHRPPAPEPAALISDPGKACAELRWMPRRSDIDTIVCDAWQATTDGPGREAPRNPWPVRWRGCSR
jgi:UDP-glucose 4-epimerase